MWIANAPSRKGRVSSEPFVHRTRTDEHSRDEPAAPKVTSTNAFGTEARSAKPVPRGCGGSPRQQSTSVPSARESRFGDEIHARRPASSQLPLQKYSVPIKY